MFGDTLTILVVILAGLGLIALAGVLGFVIGSRRRRQQAHLGKGFERARMVERTGSGIQGTPYSVYGKSSWSGDFPHNR